MTTRQHPAGSGQRPTLVVDNLPADVPASTVAENQLARGQTAYSLRRGDAKLDEQRLGALRKYFGKLVLALGWGAQAQACAPRCS